MNGRLQIPERECSMIYLFESKDFILIIGRLIPRDHISELSRRALLSEKQRIINRVIIDIKRISTSLYSKVNWK